MSALRGSITYRLNKWIIRHSQKFKIPFILSTPPGQSFKLNVRQPFISTDKIKKENNVGWHLNENRKMTNRDRNINKKRSDLAIPETSPANCNTPGKILNIT